MINVDQIVEIDYTNWKGERRKRKIAPEEIYFGRTPWHEGQQWLLLCTDVEDGEQKSFAMSGIHGWVQL